MTNKEAIEILIVYRTVLINCESNNVNKDIKAFDLAIKALERIQEDKQETFDDAIQNLKDISNRITQFIDEINEVRS